MGISLMFNIRRRSSFGCAQIFQLTVVLHCFYVDLTYLPQIWDNCKNIYHLF